MYLWGKLMLLVLMLAKNLQFYVKYAIIITYLNEMNEMEELIWDY